VEPLLRDIIDWLIAAGPIVVFGVTLTETAFFIGLVVPAEATVLVAAFLADRGVFALDDVIIATLLGAFAGDQIGYALGRYGGVRVARREGRIGRLWSRSEPRAKRLFARRSILSISGARFVSFVRTLMPWFAGMSRIHWGRFIVFDALGVAGWGLASIALGYVAGESWHRMASALGSTSALILVLMVVAFAIAARRQRLAERAAESAARQEREATEPKPSGGEDVSL